MTYPENPLGLQSQGFFADKSRGALKNQERLAAIGNQWFQRAQQERIRQERQWYLNLAFFYGNQHVQFKQVRGDGAFELYVPAAPYYRVRMTVNQVRRIIRKEISRLTAQKPNAFVVPASSEDQDVFAAQAGEQIWDSLWRRLNFNKTLRKAIFWQAVCGNGFIKTYWDKNKVDYTSNIQGDVCIDAVTPFHIFVPDLMEEEIEDQAYIIHAQVKNNTWVRQYLGVEPNSTHKFDSVEDGLQSVMGTTRNENKKDQTTVLEIWVKPGYLPEMPQGGVFTLAGDQVVQGFDSWPYEHQQYPFSKIDSMPTGKFYQASIIEDLIPLQRELNRSRSQLIESKNRMSKPQLAAEEGSVDAKKITSEPGQVIFYRQGFQPPNPIPMQNLPSYVTEEIDRLYTDMSDISGQHEVSNGSTPPGVTAATAISFLQEQDESLIATHYYSVEEGIEKVAKQTLTYVKMFWDEPRTVKIVGIDGTFDAQSFRGSDIHDNADIRIESGSALPESKAAKQALIMDMMKMGFIQPNDGLEILQIGGIEKVYEKIQIDKRQAQRENLKMRVITEEDVNAHNMAFMQEHPELQKDPNSGLKLEPPAIVPVHTYDNHQIHIEVHNNYRKSQNFEAASPMTKALFEEHVKQHEEAMANMMIHPLTGMDPSDPNAPDPEDEQDTMDQMEQEGQGQGENTGTGPEPMPEMSDEGMPQ